MTVQSRRMSLVESVTNVGIGFAVSVVANAAVLPLFGMHASLRDVVGIGGVMTVVSVVRSYSLRRTFEAFRPKQGGIVMLTFHLLRTTNLIRCARWHRGGVEEWSLSDWMTAVAGEMGEAANVVKKLNRVRDGLVGNDKSADALRDQLADEIADTAIYLDLLAARAGVDLAEAIARKFNRTSEKNGFPERLPVGEA